MSKTSETSAEIIRYSRLAARVAKTSGEAYAALGNIINVLCERLETAEKKVEARGVHGQHLHNPSLVECGMAYWAAGNAWYPCAKELDHEGPHGYADNTPY